MTKLKIDNVEQVEKVLNFWVFDEIRRLEEEQIENTNKIKQYSKQVNDLNIMLISNCSRNLVVISAQLKALRDVASRLEKHVSFIEDGELVSSTTARTNRADCI